jgi:hypothetical protein
MNIADPRNKLYYDMANHGVSMDYTFQRRTETNAIHLQREATFEDPIMVIKY